MGSQNSLVSSKLGRRCIVHIYICIMHILIAGCFWRALLVTAATHAYDRIAGKISACFSRKFHIASSTPSVFFMMTLEPINRY